MQNYDMQEVESMVDMIAGRNVDFLNEYQKCNSGGNNTTLFIISMTRLKASFDAAMLLMENGFFVEVSCVFRMILEQLSWGCYLFSIPELQSIQSIKYEKLVKQPQKTDGYLQTAMGEKRLGKLYGDLSAQAHLIPIEMMRYLEIDETSGKVDIVFRSKNQSEGEITTLLLLSLLYTEVTWKGINHFWFAAETPHDDFKNRYTDWYTEVLGQLVNLTTSQDSPSQDV